MSLGYRDLHKLRKLDDADREVIINGESVKTETVRNLIDPQIEEMSTKHAKDKATLNKGYTTFLLMLMQKIKSSKPKIQN